VMAAMRALLLVGQGGAGAKPKVKVAPRRRAREYRRAWDATSPEP